MGHGLYVFVIGLVCYAVYTQYLYFFPNFSLPGDVPARSKWGYAFYGELAELERLKWKTARRRTKDKTKKDKPFESEVEFLEEEADEKNIHARMSSPAMYAL